MPSLTISAAVIGAPGAVFLQAQTIGLAAARRGAAQRGERGLGAVEAVHRQMRVHPVVAVARDHDVADDIDIVDQAALQKRQILAVQVIDVQPGLFVGRDDQRAARIGGIDPNRRIVGGVGAAGPDRRGLAARGHRDGRQAGDDRRRLSGASGSSDAKASEVSSFDVRTAVMTISPVSIGAQGDWRAPSQQSARASIPQYFRHLTVTQTS